MGAPHSSTMAQSVDAYIGAGSGRQHVAFTVTLATLSDAAQFHIDPGFNGRLTKVTWITHTPATTAAKASTVTPSISGTNVTGGVLALTTVAANTRDKELAGTAITALNAFTSAQRILLTCSATTAFVEGSGEIQLELYNDDTRKAVAVGSMGLTYN